MSEYRKHIDSSEELGKWYDDKYREMGDGWNTPAEESNRHLDDLGVVVDSTKRLLDIGCGAGHFLFEAQKRVHAEGFEISEVGIKCAIKRGVKPESLGFVSIESDTVLTFGTAREDYIVSLGSLEHIVDLDKALDNIRQLLKPDGKFYFYCPNELWKHFDQPNERTMTDAEWISLFMNHQLYTHSMRRWNDNTAFIGGKSLGASGVLPTILPPRGNKLNIGSGQRRFDAGQGWINIDCASRPPDQVPDLICDVGAQPLPYPDNSMDFVVLHQVYEHFGLGEGHSLVLEANRVLRPTGSLILTVPDMRRLAERWLTGQIEDYIYFVNVYGAFQGLDGDRHKWGYSTTSLYEDLRKTTAWSHIIRFNWREIPGANIARDWWVLGMECVK